MSITNNLTLHTNVNRSLTFDEMDSNWVYLDSKNPIGGPQGPMGATGIHGVTGSVGATGSTGIVLIGDGLHTDVSNHINIGGTISNNITIKGTGSNSKSFSFDNLSSLNLSNNTDLHLDATSDIIMSGGLLQNAGGTYSFQTSDGYIIGGNLNINGSILNVSSTPINLITDLVIGATGNVITVNDASNVNFNMTGYIDLNTQSGDFYTDIFGGGTQLILTQGSNTDFTSNAAVVLDDTGLQMIVNNPVRNDGSGVSIELRNDNVTTGLFIKSLDEGLTFSIVGLTAGGDSQYILSLDSNNHVQLIATSSLGGSSTDTLQDVVDRGNTSTTEIIINCELDVNPDENSLVQFQEGHMIIQTDGGFCRSSLEITTTDPGRGTQSDSFLVIQNISEDGSNLSNNITVNKVSVVGESTDGSTYTSSFILSQNYYGFTYGDTTTGFNNYISGSAGVINLATNVDTSGNPTGSGSGVVQMTTDTFKVNNVFVISNELLQFGIVIPPVGLTPSLSATFSVSGYSPAFGSQPLLSYVNTGVSDTSTLYVFSEGFAFSVTDGTTTAQETISYNYSGYRIETDGTGIYNQMFVGIDDVFLGANVDAGGSPTGSAGSIQLKANQISASTQMSSLALQDGLLSLSVDGRLTGLYYSGGNLIFSEGCTIEMASSGALLLTGFASISGTYSNDNSYFNQTTSYLNVANSYVDFIGGTYSMDGASASFSGTVNSRGFNFATSSIASPRNGDMWFDGTNVKIRVGGVTKTFTLT